MTVLHVVTCCCHACQFMCLLSLLLLVPFFVNLGMALGSMASCFCLQMLLLETRLSISFQNVSVGGLNLCVWCCWCCRRRRFFVVVTVDRVLTFVVDGHGVSQSDSSLLCGSELMHGWRISFFGCWRVIGWNQFVQFGGSCFPWR